MTPATRGEVMDAAPPAEPRRVDGQRAQRGAADDRDGDERDADLGRRERGDADERRAHHAADEVPERRPLPGRAQPRHPATSAPLPSATVSVATTATRLLIAAATQAESIRAPSCPFT